MTPAQRRSAAAKKAFRSRKRRQQAIAAEQTGIAPYLQRIIAATTPDRSSTQIATELGLSPAFVRKAWRRAGLTKRQAGYRPWNKRETPSA